MIKAIVPFMGTVLVLTGSLQSADLSVGRAPHGILIVQGLVSSNLKQVSGSSPAVSSPRVLLDKYCVTCHNERLKTAALTLDTIDVTRVTDSPDVWEKVVRRLRTRAMPPPGLPRPDPAAYDALASSLEATLDRAAAANPNAGRPVVHRLNRVEYTNAIRDLLGLEIDGQSLLPADDASFGFDNMADALSVSPGLLERYMSAAAKIGGLAIGSPGPAVFETYKVSDSLLQDDRVSEGLPLGSRGGIAIRHEFPLDGEYLVKVRLQRTIGGEIRGLAESNQVEIRLDGARLAVFPVGGKFKDQPAQGTANTEFQEYLRTADAGLEVRVPVKAGLRLLGVAFAKAASAAPDSIAPAHWPVTSYTYATDRNAQVAIDSVAIGGPYNATPLHGPGHDRIFACQPEDHAHEEACAKRILATLARRAYRRPVSDEDVQPLLVSYQTGRTHGSFETGVEWALETILIDPEFLFRVERDPINVAPGSSYRVSDVELASRLSFFLWSSIPDDELLDVAARGQLKAPAVMKRQVRRMLADPRSQALIINFAEQWLGVRRLSAVTPDPAAFPDFDDNLRQAFVRETELFLANQLNEDHSIFDLLTANYTFVNERLARHYGIPNVYGDHFRRVTLADDHRRGLIGEGSILTVTSYANRTSPVLRGKWVLENILGAPPPPPPPNVPALKEKGEAGQPASVRERLEQHRKNPVCASCHARMDPLGFALENFDGVGQWRTSEADVPIDASGLLPDGTKFNGSAELLELLSRRREEFLTAFIEKLLTYAIGRGLDYYDAPLVRTIKRDAASTDYRWSSVILGIINSTSFQMRRSRQS